MILCGPLCCLARAVWLRIDGRGPAFFFLLLAIALRRLSDLICAENGLSVIEKPRLSKGKDYTRHMFADGRPPSFQERLRRSIDAALEQKPSTFEGFLDLLRAAGVMVVESGKHLKFLAAHEDGLPDPEKYTRCDTLRDDYTEQAMTIVPGLKMGAVVSRRYITADRARGTRQTQTQRGGFISYGASGDIQTEKER